MKLFRKRFRLHVFVYKSNNQLVGLEFQARFHKKTHLKIYAIVPGNWCNYGCFLAGAEELRLHKLARSITFFS